MAVHPLPHNARALVAEAWWLQTLGSSTSQQEPLGAPVQGRVSRGGCGAALSLMCSRGGRGWSGMDRGLAVVLFM